MARASKHTRLAATVAAAAAAVTLSTTAGAAPAAVDIMLWVGADTQGERATRAPNGGTVAIPARTFWVTVLLELPSAAPGGGVKVHAEIGGGLRWGTDDPDASEGCTSTPTIANCDAQTIAGQPDDGWGWEVVAPADGSYAFSAEIVDSYDVDPDPSNNASSITIVVAPPPPPKPPAPSVAAGRVKVTPAKPRAGWAVSARVRVSAGGAPVRPLGVACAAAIGTTKLKGKAKAASGSATCTFRTPRSAKGKTLRGSVSFTARGTKFTKRFSARLG